MRKKIDQKHPVAIHWFRNGLRLHDNACLLDACEHSDRLLPIYVIDEAAPFAQTEGRRAGTIRANFALESIDNTNEKLKRLGSELLVVVGKSEDVLPEIIASMNVSALFYEREPAAPIRISDAKVLEAIQSRLDADGSEKCEVYGYETHNLHPMEWYLAKCKDGVAPSSYGKFTSVFQSLQVPEEVPAVTSVPALPDGAGEKLQATYGDRLGRPTLQYLGYEAESDLMNREKSGIPFRGGEDEALRQLDACTKRARWIATFDKPKTSPNKTNAPDTTALSPYVKHGCLSARRFYHKLAEVYANFDEKERSKPPVSLHGQLMWREYNYLMGYTTPNFDKMVDNPVARQIPWDDDPQLLEAWKTSQTGYPFIDALAKQLRETGWVHHLGRHALACFLTRGDLWQSWEKGAEVFEYYLIDADWSINNFNWQWLSCTAHFYQYFRCYSPVAFGKKTDPNGDFIRKWLPQFKDVPKKYIYEPWEMPPAMQEKHGIIIGKDYPYPIIEHKSMSKANMGRMKEAYDAQKSGQAMPPAPHIRDEPAAKRQRC